MKRMKIGAHVSIAGGVELAPKRARNIEAECFQFFSRSPRGGTYKKITDEKAVNFLKECEKWNFIPGEDYIIHTPYFINLASEDNRIYYGSIKAISEELETADKLRAPYVITHIGSGKNISVENAEQRIKDRVWKALEAVHKNNNYTALLLLEIAAGSGKILGDTIEEIAYFIKKAQKFSIPLGFCFDTCHAFAAGYDLRTGNKTEKIFEQIDKEIGLDKLKVIHFNDSKAEFNSHKDRHAHIGKGKIGEKGLREVVNQAKKLKVNLYLETKHDKIKEDLILVKKFRQEADGV